MTGRHGAPLAVAPAAGRVFRWRAGGSARKRRLVSPLERLRSDEALRREGVAHVVDAILARRVRDAVDLTGLLSLVDQLLVRPLGERAVTAHLLPGFDRFVASARERGTTVGEWIPDDATEELERLLLQTRFPRFEWARAAVDPKLLERLFAPVLQDLLTQFIGKLPGVGAFSALARVGGRAAESALGGKTGGAARSIAADFSKSALATLRDALAARLASEEGRALVEAIRGRAFRHCLQVPIETVLADFDALPWREVSGLLPAIAEHQLRSVLGRVALRAEVRAFLEVEGDKPIEALLDEAGVLPDVRAYLRVQSEGVLEALIDDPRFATWFAALTA